MMEGTGHKDGLDAIAERGWVFLELLFLPFKWTWWIEQPEGLGSSKNIKDCYFLGFVSLICPPSVVLTGLHLSRHSSFHLWHWPCYQASVQSLVYETHLCGFNKLEFELDLQSHHYTCTVSGFCYFSIIWSPCPCDVLNCMYCSIHCISTSPVLVIDFLFCVAPASPLRDYFWSRSPKGQILYSPAAQLARPQHTVTQWLKVSLFWGVTGIGRSVLQACMEGDFW